jgi:hypothetical protein
VELVQITGLTIKVGAVAACPEDFVSRFLCQKERKKTKLISKQQKMSALPKTRQDLK